MPLITQDVEKKIPLSINLSKDIKEEVERYCKWAKIQDLGFFLGEAAKRFFARDKEWQGHCKNVKDSKKITEGAEV